MLTEEARRRMAGVLGRAHRDLEIMVRRNEALPKKAVEEKQTVVHLNIQNSNITTTRKHSEVHHLAMLVSVVHGLRVSECLALTVDDVQAGSYLLCRRKKCSARHLQTLHKSPNPLFDKSQIVEYAAKVKSSGQELLFDFCRQYADRLIKHYGEEAGIASEKCHWHSLKHSLAMLVFAESLSLSQTQQVLGHEDERTTLIYMRELDGQKAIQSRDRAFAAIAQL